MAKKLHKKLYNFLCFCIDKKSSFRYNYPKGES